MQAASDYSQFFVKTSSEDDVRWAARLAHRVYEGFDAIPEETMLAWYQANPHGFSTLWHRSERVGNFDALPLRHKALQDFVAGRVLESDFKADDLFTETEVDQIRDLYFESVVIDPSFQGSRNLLLKTWITSSPTYLSRLCPLEQIDDVYAIAASTQGSQVIRRFGMLPLGVPSDRLDAHQLYHGTGTTWRAAISRFRRSLPT